jgi:methylphosphotriester-DNA--protein-cysteine methyltransferase
MFRPAAAPIVAAMTDATHKASADAEHADFRACKRCRPNQTKET